MSLSHATIGHWRVRNTLIATRVTSVAVEQFRQSLGEPKPTAAKRAVLSRKARRNARAQAYVVRCADFLMDWVYARGESGTEKTCALERVVRKVKSVHYKRFK